MEFTFADRVNGLKPSAIREILKHTQDPSVIPFAAGNPAPEAFPADAVRAFSDEILRECPNAALQYSVTEGLPSLREAVRDYLIGRGILAPDSTDAVLITSGAQQVMGLAAKVLVNEGDVVVCEDPSFIGSLNSFRSLGARLVGVPVEADGMNIDALEQVLKTTERVKFIYTIPNFQNPTGVTMSAEKRRRLYDLAMQYAVPVIEDDPYGELRFAGQAQPAVKSFDTDGGVLYVGSFSKILAPGVRVGYAVGAPALIAKMTVAKQGEDVHTTVWSQMLCDRLLRDASFPAHLEKLRAIYACRAGAMAAAIEKHLAPRGVKHYPVEGGLFMWCMLPEGVDMLTFCRRAVEEKRVAVVPGTAFLPQQDGESRAFRVNFSTPAVEVLEPGVKALAELLDEMLS